MTPTPEREMCYPVGVVRTVVVVMQTMVAVAQAEEGVMRTGVVVMQIPGGLFRRAAGRARL